MGGGTEEQAGGAATGLFTGSRVSSEVVFEASVVPEVPLQLVSG